MKKEIFDTKQIILDNGLKLITIKKDTQLAAVHVGVNTGSLYEEQKEKGIAHFIEHMLFKGTKNRNNEKLNSDLENLGGEYNAYTDYSSTVYSTTVLSDELNESLELLGDMLTNSIFPKEELEKERGVILAEIRSSRDDVEELSFKRVNEIGFKYSPLRFDTAGEETTINKFTRKQLMNFYNKYYVPNNTIISIVSPFGHEYVVELVQKHFGSWSSRELNKSTVEFEDNIPVKETSYKKEIEQSIILYLYTFYNLTKEEELALRILNHRFGESANSILFRQLREERGLAYDVYTHLDSTSNVKTLYIYTAVSEENVEEAIEAIDSAIDDIKNEKIVFDDNTIVLMKKIFKTAVASTLEDASDLSNYVVHQAMDEEDIYQFVEDMKDMENIKSKDLYSIARKVLCEPTIHVLLPEKSEE